VIRRLVAGQADQQRALAGRRRPANDAVVSSGSTMSADGSIFEKPPRPSPRKKSQCAAASAADYQIIVAIAIEILPRHRRPKLA